MISKEFGFIDQAIDIIDVKRLMVFDDDGLNGLQFRHESLKLNEMFCDWADAALI